MKSGFTLIEILVVILIIGVLAAIALPQYQLAVDKAKYTQAMVLLDAINESQNRYILARGTYTNSFYDLDIDIPATGIITNAQGATNGTYEDDWGMCWLHDTGYGACSIKLAKYVGAWYFLYWDVKNNSSNLRQCWVSPKTSARANRLCKAVTGKTTGTDSGSYTKYNFF